MKGNKLINLCDAHNPTDASNKKYVDTIANSIFYGSEPFQVDISTNNYRIKNVHTSVTIMTLWINFFCETIYRKMTNDHQLLKISNDGRWDAKDKTIIDLNRVQYDDEAAAPNNFRGSARWNKTQ